ncbi:MAG: UDP-glucose 4-epimerase [Gaiellales bacterium]|nr:UDP-glucose 4-epimerase [Gaiellales bacterium]
MDAIVTGGAGFIGSHITDALLARGDSVVVVDNLATGKRERVPDGAELAELDIRDGTALRDLVDRVRPSAIFHLAAQADVRRSVDDPGFDADVNVRGTIEVLEAARRSDARVLFSSTGGALYGEADTIPSPETTPIAPMSPYGTSKLGAEQYVGLFNRLYDTAHVVLRYGNVYGPRQDPHGEAGVVAIFFGRLANGGTPLVFGDGRQTRDYVYVGDVVAANLAALDYDGPATAFNIGTQTETSVLELLAACQSAAGTDVTPEHRPARRGELDRRALDCSLAQSQLGWRPTTSLDQGLAETLRSLHP